MRKKIVIGKVDYEGRGFAHNSVDIEYSLEDGRFSASGNIWQASRKDILSGGQNLEEIASLFPDNELVQRIVTVWRKWHLNDMHAGSPKQEEFLAQLNLPNHNHYENAKAKLKDAGLDPDESYLHNGKPYEYGSAWLSEELPPSVISEIESWPGTEV
jgi:hypothetical protein